MPEKAKRRKNNKNKRKNKNFRIDTNSNSSGSNNATDSHPVENKDVEEEGKCFVDLNEEKEGSENNLSDISSITSDISNKDGKITENNDSYNNLQVHNIESNELDEISKIPSHVLKISLEETQDSSLVLNTYVVESPDQSNKKKSKLSIEKKSKSVDNDESLRIIEITEENSTLIEGDNKNLAENSGLVSEVDSDIEWERTLDLNQHDLPMIEEPVTGTLSITTIPLTVAHCEQAKLLSPEEELSLRRYLQTLNLTTNPSTSLEIKTEIEQIINSEIRHRLRKKGLAEDLISQRLCPARILDVIDEEGSGDSSLQSRRHSYLSDKKSENDDLEDDVFEQPSSHSTLRKNDIQWDNTLRKKSLVHQIPQKCVLVGAKLKEPEISEARGNWTVQTVEKMTGAEVVYLTDSSSSTSSVYDVGEDTGNEQETDVSVRMITPTIEVTDTANFLKETFIPDNKENTYTAKRNIVNDLTTELKEFSSNHNENKQETDYSFDDLEKKLHEIVVLATDDIKSNLIVKDIDDNEKPHDCLNAFENLDKLDINSACSTQIETKPKASKCLEDYDLQMKVLKCELNDAINNLIKEVSDSENLNENSKNIFTRQDSSSSVSSSQCTAIYNPNSSLNDISNNDDLYQTGKESKESSNDIGHVNEVIKNIYQSSSNFDYNVIQPQKLRDMCVEKISSFPYGLKILEELANVSLRLQNMNNIESDFSEETNCCKTNRKEIKQKIDSGQFNTAFHRKSNQVKEKRTQEKNYTPPLPPPPIPPPPPPPRPKPRNSSLKKPQDNPIVSDIPPVETPYVCLSPSQKMLMEKTNTVVTKENVSPAIDGCIKDVNSGRDTNTRQTEIVYTSPFKSQTGSRLMALICDPTITSNINSKLNKSDDKQIYSMKKTQHESTKSSRKYSDSEPAYKPSADTFKPVPPPRPKKLSTFYESDQGSDFAETSFKSMKRERKFFHFSTGNLSKEIEDDISTIQNMHRNYMNVRNQNNEVNYPRRPSLPKDLCDQQMEYIRQKEKEVEAEIQRLQSEKFKPLVKKGPRAPMITEKEINTATVRNTKQTPWTKGILWNTQIQGKGKKEKTSSLFSSSQEELLRDKMYSEYLNEIAEREQRKQHKVIKITNTPLPSDARLISKSMSDLDVVDSRVNNRIEEEFISKARERWNKLGIRDPESEDERNTKINVYREPKVIEHKIKVIEAGIEKDVNRLPNHLQEFVTFTAKDKEKESATTGESESKETSTHVVILCAVMLLVLAIGRYILRLLRNV